MFECNYINDLTDDYITIASRMAILGGVNPETFKNLQELAALGQKNAIQDLYLLSKLEGSISQEIENEVVKMAKKEGFEKISLSVNDSLIVANRYFGLGEKELFTEYFAKALGGLRYQMRETHSLTVAERYYELASSFYNAKYLKDHMPRIKKLNKALKEEIKNGNKEPHVLFAYANNLATFFNSKSACDKSMAIYDSLASRPLSYQKPQSENNEKGK